jgi:SAM-dependent methyltransferase
MASRQDRQDLQHIYGTRFAGKTEYRAAVWEVLTVYFGQWVPQGGTVLDLGAGYCEFINNLSNVGRRYAMDLNPEVQRRAGSGVEVLNQDCSEAWPLGESELDVVFTSNFLEHLSDKDAVLRTLSNAYRCLKPGGRIICLGPNIRYVSGAYWDFFDHHVELTERSMSEALSLCGFDIDKQVSRFLPYTMSRGRRYPIWMLRLYLRTPAFWPLFGQQFLVIGRRPAGTA